MAATTAQTTKTDFNFFNNDKTSLLTDDNDPDTNFYNNVTIDSKYYNIDETRIFLKTLSKSRFSILSLNIRSLNKNIENLKSMLSELGHEFKIICLTESWCKDEDTKVSKFEIDGYKSIHQPRINGLGGGICVFVHKSLNVKQRKDLNVNCTDCESLSVEIINDKIKNSIVTTMYRPPESNLKQFKKLFKTHISKCCNKNLYVTGDFNINLLNCEIDSNVTQFLNTLFQHNVIPLINKPTRITRTSETLIDNILTNNFHCSKIQSGVIKTDISDHFPIFMTEHIQVSESNEQPKTIFQRNINEKSISEFRNLLQNNTDWEIIKKCEDANSAYNLFIRFFSTHYNKEFPKIQKQIKSKTLQSTWMTQGLLKSSKRKQRLYERFLKHKSFENEKEYKKYKKCFENTKKKSKINHYSNLLKTNTGNAKKTWDIIKEVTGKKKIKESFPNRIVNEKGTEVHEMKDIAEQFNEFYVTIGKNLADKIEPSCKNFETYITNSQYEMHEKDLSQEELEKAFSSLKPNKGEGIDEIHVNVIKSVFDLIKDPLHYIFNISLKYGIFPNDLKIAKVIPVFKSGDEALVANYRPISVLPCFSKILERIMYNRLHDHLLQHNLLYQKQFGFQGGHSTEHAVVNLVDEILKGFDQNKFTLGVFIDLSKAFDTVDHKILIRKLELYGIRNNNLKWFKNYLTGRKQGVSFSSGLSQLKNIVCGVPQGSILGPLLFLIYVNDLYLSSNILNFILFADDTNIIIFIGK